jgi:hypothetical protein
MCAKGIGTSMGLTFAGAVVPLARVPLLSAPDVLVVEVLHQPIHVAEVTSATSIPSADSDLVSTLATIVIFLIGAKEAKDAGGVGDIARAIGGDRGSRGWRWVDFVLNRGKRSLAVPGRDTGATTLGGWQVGHRG